MFSTGITLIGISNLRDRSLYAKDYIARNVITNVSIIINPQKNETERTNLKLLAATSVKEFVNANVA